MEYYNLSEFSTIFSCGDYESIDEMMFNNGFSLKRITEYYAFFSNGVKTIKVIL